MRPAFALSVLLAATLAAQGTLDAAARNVRTAWLAHDAQALVGQSPTLVLQIPGADPSAPLGRAQAIELLRRYLRPATERALAIRDVREVSPGSGFAELEREYTMVGTGDVRRETLFLRFRAVGHDWQLVEVRTAP